jgi:hypothetical protein
MESIDAGTRSGSQASHTIHAQKRRSGILASLTSREPADNSGRDSQARCVTAGQADEYWVADGRRNPSGFLPHNARLHVALCKESRIVSVPIGSGGPAIPLAFNLHEQIDQLASGEFGMEQVALSCQERIGIPYRPIRIRAVGLDRSLMVGFIHLAEQNLELLQEINSRHWRHPPSASSDALRPAEQPARNSEASLPGRRSRPALHIASLRLASPGCAIRRHPAMAR